MRENRVHHSSFTKDEQLLREFSLRAQANTPNYTVCLGAASLYSGVSPELVARSFRRQPTPDREGNNTYLSAS